MLILHMARRPLAHARTRGRFRTEKGITPIIAIVILLLITIAIAGVAYTFITGLVTNTASSAVLFTGASCGQNAPVGKEVVMYFKNLASSTIAIPTQAGGGYQNPQNPFVPDVNTIALYRFNSASPLTDSAIPPTSPGTNHLTKTDTGTYITFPTTGGIGGTFGDDHASVNGAGSSVAVLTASPAPELEPQTVSVEAWVKFSGLIGPFYPVVTKASAANIGYSLSIVGQEIWFAIGYGSGSATAKTSVSGLSGWHYVVGRYDPSSGSAEISIDAAQSGTFYGSATTIPGTAIVYGGGYLFLGDGLAPRPDSTDFKFDEVRISDTLRPFGVPVPGGAACSGQGTSSVQCGNLIVNSKSGKSMNVQLSDTTIPGGGAFSVTDTAGCSGKCDYDVVYNGQPAAVSKVC